MAETATDSSDRRVPGSVSCRCWRRAAPEALAPDQLGLKKLKCELPRRLARILRGLQGDHYMSDRVCRRFVGALASFVLLCAGSVVSAWDGEPWADYTPFITPITAPMKQTLVNVKVVGDANGRVLGRMGQIGDSISEASSFFSERVGVRAGRQRDGPRLRTDSILVGLQRYTTGRLEFVLSEPRQGNRLRKQGWLAAIPGRCGRSSSAGGRDRRRDDPWRLFVGYDHVRNQRRRSGKLGSCRLEGQPQGVRTGLHGPRGRSGVEHHSTGRCPRHRRPDRGSQRCHQIRCFRARGSLRRLPRADTAPSS